ncbi:MAG: hypothetical protein JJLCMIEE_03650 [Acidimicrobiales bacterium]|nr:MAG: aminoacyl-tRNA hydrolase [Actinomycetota bacterium]MBV6510494.1 hypothetical protein [Acidimicrobiales bacterium]RIK07152.1 MAG: aminoacyl-tRNA hydrolase [Acidobacteriota bacterium]
MADELWIDDDCVIDLADVDWRFSTSGGPGGQHANRSRTRVEATIDLAAARGLSDDQRRRLTNRFGESASVSVDETRSQTRNRQIALDRLAALLRQGLARPEKRRPTRRTEASRQRRLESKRKRGELKRSRGRPRSDDY